MDLWQPLYAKMQRIIPGKEFDKESHTMSLNSQYLVLFNNPRDQKQVMVLARQMCPSQSEMFLRTCRMATSKPFGYLLIDLNQILTMINVFGLMCLSRPIRFQLQNSHIFIIQSKKAKLPRTNSGRPKKSSQFQKAKKLSTTHSNRFKNK